MNHAQAHATRHAAQIYDQDTQSTGSRLQPYLPSHGREQAESGQAKTGHRAGGQSAASRGQAGRNKVILRQAERKHPYHFQRKEAPQVKDAKEWYKSIGKRQDGMVEKNT